MTNRTAIISVAAGVLVVGGALTAVALMNPPASTPVESLPSASAPVAESSTPTAPSTPTAEPYDTAASLLFIIEEEKLAHDVYVTLESTWGANIFANISDSETTHQGLLVPLLDAHGIADPRSSEVGVFVDPDLQSLYNDLIARGTTSLAEAMQVGILIEEKDIADLTVAMAAEDEADVISVYDRLLSGSENHLASFQRQA